jgi:hypothetical protein
MKNIIIKILLVLSILSFSGLNGIWSTYAATWITVTVTEKIPGAWCDKINAEWNIDKNYKPKKWETQMYECTVEKWFWSVIKMMWNIIKYFTYIASLGAVLFIVVNGILYSMWWAEPSLKDEAKKRITATLIWLVLLFLSWIVLNMIAPWIYK